jgi:alkanesulfonate monooxygenase SsuD/methylene tetrahydromethanopterin reductase-like flavin-dependent oxidoreductase (luciferase family)
LLLGMHATAAEHRVLLDRYAAAAVGHGHDPGAVSHAAAHVAFVADTVGEARAALRRAMPGWLATTSRYVRLDGAAGPARDPATYVEHLLDIHPVGPPELCVQRLTDSIGATGATGIRRLLLMVEGGGDPRRTLDTIARLGAQVLPHLR